MTDGVSNGNSYLKAGRVRPTGHLHVRTRYLDAMQLSRRDWVFSLAGGLLGGALAGDPAFAAPGAPPPKPAKPPAPGTSREQLLAGCRGALVTSATVVDGAELARIGEWATKRGAASDTYGGGGVVEELEKKVAALLGFPAACMMPTGTMGQLAVLRIYADRGRSRAVGLHPSSHHVLHEDAAFEVLLGLHPVFLGPWGRAILAEDVTRVSEPLSMVSIEMPVRWTGQLQTWAELDALKIACRKLNVPLHVDGARLWECAPAYGRSLADICRGFSSVYVSLYKTIGALGGAVIAGPRDFIEQAHLWRHRLGGNLFRFFPYAASALMRIDDTIAKLPAWNARAKRLAARLAKDPRLVVSPSPPSTSLFHIYLRGDPQALNARRDQVARDRKIWVTHGFSRARVPDWADAELNLGPGSDAVTDEEAAEAVLAVIA